MNRYTKSKKLNFITVVIDVLVIVASHVFSNFITSRVGGKCMDWQNFVYYATTMILMFFIFDFYTYVDDTRFNNCVSIWLAGVMSGGLKLVLSLVFGFDYYGTVYSPVMFVTMTTFLAIWRYGFSTILLKKSKSILIVDSVSVPTRTARKLKYYDKKPELIWYCMVDESKPEQMDWIVNDLMPSYDAVFISPHLSNGFSRRILRTAIDLKKDVRKIGSLYNVSLHYGKLRNTTDTPVIELVRLGLSPWQTLVKRVGDIFAASVLVVLTAPLMLFIALLINLDSSGGAIFRQERYTINQKKFTLYKFRTMRSDAEKNGAQLATKNDDRLTRVGAILRKTHLDELPQLFNVLIGDMSFVGPRPERPVFADEFVEKIMDYELRFKVKAGITGYAQVYGNYSSRASDKILMDIIYMSKYSFPLDIKLMLMTLRQIFIHDRAEGEDVELHTFLDDPNKEAERIKASFAGMEKKNEKSINNNSDVQ